MALRHAVLAALLEGDASGYQLAKRFDVGVANFWSATPQQLYRELDRLADDGLVGVVVVEQQRRPNKRVFSLTDAGRDALRAFTTEAPRPVAMRDDLLVQVQAVDAGDADAVMTALAARRERAQAKLARYDRLRDQMLDGRSEADYVRTADRIGPYLTVTGGAMYEQQNLRWVTRAMEIMAEWTAPDRRSGSEARTLRW